MKKFISLLLSFSFLFCCTNVYGFTPSKERRIVIGEFENTGDSAYDYLGSVILETLASSASRIPFVTLTDEERKTLSRAIGDTTINYRLEPAVSTGEIDPAEYPVVIYGHYHVDETSKETDEDGTVRRIGLDIRVYDHLTGSRAPEYELITDLDLFIRDPVVQITDFLRGFVGYKTHTAVLTAEPQDALIFLDGALRGVGKVTDLILTPGEHRITVKRKGYSGYSDIIYVDRDDFSAHVRLEPVPSRVVYRFMSNVDGASVYLDEAYVGETPLTVTAEAGHHTVSFIKEGYVAETFSLHRLEEKYVLLTAGLLTPGGESSLFSDAETHRKRARVLSWFGIGTLGAAVLLGTASTLNTQRADLYEMNGDERASRARSRSVLYRTLTITSLTGAASIFTFSFLQTLKYFNLYNRSTGEIPVARFEVAF